MSIADLHFTGCGMFGSFRCKECTLYPRCYFSNYPIKEVKAFKVDGDKIKADTFYKLVDGEAVEVDEED